MKSTCIQKLYQTWRWVIFEELFRRFNENAEAGDHYIPREVIRLMTHLLFLHDDASILTKPALTQRLYDAAADTGSMSSVAQEYLLS